MARDSADETTVKTATDPTLVRSVVEDRGGFPAHVERSEGGGDHGLLRVGFDDSDEPLTELSWEAFLAEFEEKDLVARYTDDGSDVDGYKPVVLTERAAKP